MNDAYVTGTDVYLLAIVSSACYSVPTMLQVR